MNNSRYFHKRITRCLHKRQYNEREVLRRKERLTKEERRHENKKMTKLEKYWILYDVGNSAFTLLVSTIIRSILTRLPKCGHSEVDYLAYWGYAASISTIIVALLGPTVGSIADTQEL